MFFPDPNFFIRIPDPGSIRSRIRIKEFMYVKPKKLLPKFPENDYFPIPDSGVKNPRIPPDSRSRMRNTGYRKRFEAIDKEFRYV
jgi:hypothetical protein